MNSAPLITPRLPTVSGRAPTTAVRSACGERWIGRAKPAIAASTVVNHERAPIKVLVAAESAAAPAQSVQSWLRGDDISIVGEVPHYEQVPELAAKLQPDVVVISFGMALRNGLEVIRRNLGQICGARLLVLTPHRDHAFGEHIAASGAAGFLQEQACPQQLAAAVRDVHEKSEFFPAGFVRHAGETASRPGQPAAEKISTELTAREREVLQHIAEGNANKQTASKLGISIKTVEKHRQSLMDKLRIHETATLTRYALYAGIAR